MSTAPRGLLREARRVALRACLARLLSSALGYPSKERIASVDACLAASLEQAVALPVSVANLLRAVSESRSIVAPLDLELEYIEIFGHVSRSDCNPCEVAYRAKHIFQAAQMLADVLGVYREFGLEVGLERPDHVTVELEFQAFLTYREANAWADGKTDCATEFREAQAQFLREHLGSWGRMLARLVKARARSGYFVGVAELMDAFLISEGRRLGVRIAPARMTKGGDPGSSSESPLKLAKRGKETVFSG